MNSTQLLDALEAHPEAALEFHLPEGQRIPRDFSHHGR